MRQFLKILIPIAVTIFFTQPAFGYGPKGYEPSNIKKITTVKAEEEKGTMVTDVPRDRQQIFQLILRNE